MKAQEERRKQEEMEAQGYQKRVQYEQQGIRAVSEHCHCCGVMCGHASSFQLLMLSVKTSWRGCSS